MYNAKAIDADGTPLDWGASPRSPTPPPDPLPAATRSRGIVGWVGPLVSLAIVAAVLVQIAGLDFGRVWSLLPTSPLFWLIFAAAYLTGPACEWVIFDRLWHLPASGFLALVRKMVGNEILLGYSGELYFYGWARRHASLVAAPFGAVKDVAILSAAVGNVATLALMAAVWPLLASVHLGVGMDILLGSVAVVVLTSLGAMLLRRRIFSLSADELRFIAGMHLARTILKQVLTAALWHMAMPAVALSWWLLLSALRMVVSRLPFLPNKDVVFAGLAVFLIGRDAELSDMIAMMATLILATHLAVGATLGGWDIVRVGRRA